MIQNGKIRKKPLIIAGIIFFAVICTAVFLLYKFNIIPHIWYTGEHFGIATYVSAEDADKDGVDDQTDILNSAKAYVATEPKYESRYYETGYSNDEYGVCTDVVAEALLHSGYDLMELVNEDILAHPEDYNMSAEDADINIDFRRVRNLKIYFEHTAISLTTDTTEIEEWQGGDIVIFEGHIGIVSDKRNFRGVPFLIHNGSPSQLRYEEDVLGKRDDIIGHYRVS